MKQEAARVSGLPPGHIQYDVGASPATGGVRPLGRFGVQQESEPQPAAPSLGTNFNGISYTGWIPPDPVLAAGPSNLVLVTNGSVTIRNKTGGLVASTSLEDFFSSVRASGENAFDPKVVFDVGSNRFFVAALGRINDPGCTAGNCVSHFFLGVSKSSSPTTTDSSDWYFYSFDATLDGSTPTTNWADFPGLGLDDDVVVLTANMFAFSDGFQYAKIRILDKSVLIAGGSVTWTDFFDMTDPSSGLEAFTLQPALTFGSPGTFFLISASSSSVLCDLVVWGIENALSSPTLTSQVAAASGTCANPPNAQQLGGGTALDTGDKRLNSSVYRNNSLWTAHAIRMNFGSGNVSASRWVEIDVASWPNSVGFIQDSTFGADGIWYFYPSVMADASSNLAIVLSRSSTSEYASAYYTGRQGTEAANTLQPSELLKAGAGNYRRLDGNGNNRWGDFLGIGLDPSDGSFWILGEYATASNQWGTWVGNFAFDNPVPSSSSLSPSSTTAGGSGFTLTVNGSNFLESSVVRWNGSDRTTTFVSATQLQASIPSSDISTAGTAQVTVFNPSPGGGTSNALTFTINNPAPSTSSLSPSSATAGGAGFTLTVNGSNFVSSSVVRWKGSDRTTTFVSSTQLQASIPSSDISTAGTAQVTVFNPTPGGGTSSGLTFTINNPAPSASSLSPSRTRAGGAGFTLTVNGSNFVASSVVRWNGSDRTTTFVSSTQLQASIPSSDISTAGTAQVTVFNPTPGGGTSSGLTFTIFEGFTLTARKGGSGKGTVTSSPAGINCNADCTETSADYENGTSVTLTASAASGSSFSGWSGEGCSGTGTCTVTLSANRTVTATFSKSFTDDPLSAQVTPVKRVHITDLREAINTLRSNNGLSAYSYTDSTLTAGTTQAKVVHITDLRTALDGVYDAKSRTRPSYTDSTITAGQTVIKKAHIAEIRSAVRDVE
ncbi:MAG: hypothetical protein HYY45_14160 [Deltaproteobacteria bacterium]|nr:hypothetical protein [Deltaproteobacteria bacterium]